MVAVEFRKQLFRMRTYLSMLLMVGIPTLMTAAFLLTGGRGDHIVRGVLLQLPYIAVFLILAWWWFHRKDIVS